MASQPSDTHPDADRVQLDLMRAATVGRRASLALTSSHWVRSLSRRAIEEANPDLDSREVALRLLELEHGGELARRVRAYLARRS